MQNGGISKLLYHTEPNLPEIPPTQLTVVSRRDMLQVPWKEQAVPPFVPATSSAGDAGVDLCSYKYIYLGEIVKQSFLREVSDWLVEN